MLSLLKTKINWEDVILYHMVLAFSCAFVTSVGWGISWILYAFNLISVSGTMPASFILVVTIIGPVTNFVGSLVIRALFVDHYFTVIKNKITQHS